jgi:hypothetical protein
MKCVVHLLIVPIVFFGSCSSSASAECSPSAKSLVEEFVRLDHEGHRLGSAGHDAIWRLAQDNGDPPGWPIAITLESHMLSSTPLPGGRCRYRIRFVVTGTIRESSSGELSLTAPGKREEDWDLYLNCQKGQCLISVSYDEFKIPPHPGRAAVLSWLKELEGIRSTDSGKQAVRLLREKVSVLPE